MRPLGWEGDLNAICDYNRDPTDYNCSLFLQGSS